MKEFTRAALRGYGLNEEQLENVMALYGMRFRDYVRKEDAEAEKQAAVKEALENAPRMDATNTPEYKRLLQQFETYKARQRARCSEVYRDVKDKFFDMVYDSLDHSQQAAPVGEQLKALKRDFAEYFYSAGQTTPAKPVFGECIEGEMPQGDCAGEKTN